jgi:hypothetical protein
LQVNRHWNNELQGLQQSSSREHAEFTTWAGQYAHTTVEQDQQSIANLLHRCGKK